MFENDYSQKMHLNNECIEINKKTIYNLTACELIPLSLTDITMMTCSANGVCVCGRLCFARLTWNQLLFCRYKLNVSRISSHRLFVSTTQNTRLWKSRSAFLHCIRSSQVSIVRIVHSLSTFHSTPFYCHSMVFFNSVCCHSVSCHSVFFINLDSLMRDFCEMRLTDLPNGSKMLIILTDCF